MAVIGMNRGADPFTALCTAFYAYRKACVNDRGAQDYIFQIDQALRGLDMTSGSPGHRAAMRAMSADSSLEPKHLKEDYWK